MKSHFTSDFFAGNRRRLREQVPSGVPMVISANGQMQKSADTPFPFQQDTNFWYLTGLDQADLVLVIDQDSEYLILPDASSYQEIFDGRLSQAAIAKRSGIKKTYTTSEGQKRLESLAKQSKSLATILPPPEYLEVYGMYTNPARGNLTRKIKDANPTIKLVDVREQMAALRFVKQPAEILAIRHAVNQTADVLKNIQADLRNYKYEYELEAEITGHFLRHGMQPAWKPIIGSGVKSCILHASNNNAKLKAEDVVVIDVGAANEYYNSDLTRTFSIGGQPSKRQQLVYTAVREAQDYAIGQLKPGVVFADCMKDLRNFVGDKLVELGLAKTNNKRAQDKYYPHTSHYIGLDIHDLGDYHRPLEPGVVLTVEPGIYIKEERTGVRIEDDVLITETGHEVLSHRLPREL